MSDSQAVGHLSYPPKTGDSGDSGDLAPGFTSPPSASPAEEGLFPAYAFEFYDRHTDPYWIRAMAGWERIAALKHLPGGMQWAAKHHPDRYYRVTSELPAAWERLWDEAAPLDDFQAGLDEWVLAHKELIDLYPVTKGTK